MGRSPYGNVERDAAIVDLARRGFSTAQIVLSLTIVGCKLKERRVRQIAAAAGHPMPRGRPVRRTRATHLGRATRGGTPSVVTTTLPFCAQSLNAPTDSDLDVLMAMFISVHGVTNGYRMVRDKLRALFPFWKFPRRRVEAAWRRANPGAAVARRNFNIVHRRRVRNGSVYAPYAGYLWQVSSPPSRLLCGGHIRHAT